LQNPIIDNSCLHSIQRPSPHNELFDLLASPQRECPNCGSTKIQRTVPDTLSGITEDCCTRCGIVVSEQRYLLRDLDREIHGNKPACHLDYEGLCGSDANEETFQHIAQNVYGDTSKVSKQLKNAVAPQSRLANLKRKVSHKLKSSYMISAFGFYSSSKIGRIIGDHAGLICDKILKQLKDGSIVKSSLYGLRTGKLADAIIAYLLTCYYNERTAEIYIRDHDVEPQLLDLVRECFDPLNHQKHETPCVTLENLQRLHELDNQLGYELAIAQQLVLEGMKWHGIRLDTKMLQGLRRKANRLRREIIKAVRKDLQANPSLGSQIVNLRMQPLSRAIIAYLISQTGNNKLMNRYVKQQGDRKKPIRKELLEAVSSLHL